MSNKPVKQVTCKVINKFRYPVNGVTQWLSEGTKLALPKHAAQELVRQHKVEIVK